MTDVEISPYLHNRGFRAANHPADPANQNVIFRAKKKKKKTKKKNRTVAAMISSQTNAHYAKRLVDPDQPSK